jgi:uncharacterized coiled-coil protein SlyX
MSAVAVLSTRGGMMDERWVDLEVRYTYVERQLEELSAVLFEQRRTIDDLERRVKELEGRLQQVGDPVGNEPPPHY